MKNIQYIFEEAYVPSNSDFKIIQEGYDEVGNKKITIRAILQTAGGLNQNGRVYPPEVLQSIVEQLLPKVKARALLSELDHPMLETSDPQVLKRRASVVSLKNACALITDLQFDGNQIAGILEILNTDAGQIVQALIKDGVKIGFSLRALGVVDKDPNTGATVVKKTKAITYDVVSNPSHANATIVEVINEGTDLGKILEEYETLAESVQTIEKDADIVLAETTQESDKHEFCTNGVCMKGEVNEIVEFIIENVLADEKLKKVQLKI